MKTTTWRCIGLVALGCFSFAPVSVRGAAGPYHFLKEIPVGGEGGWDYLSIDGGARRLYVSHATKVVVIDLEQETVPGETADTPGIHGVAPAPELHPGFSSNGREAKKRDVDLQTFNNPSKG